MSAESMIANPGFEYRKTVGFIANGGRGFNNPVDLTWDSSGLLYVLNRAGPEVGIRLPYKRVTICTFDEEYLGEFGTGGTGDGQFWWPSSLAFDRAERLYIADEALHHISIFSKEGEFLEKWGVAGSRDGELNRPSYIAFDRQDNLYVSDSLNHRVQIFSRQGRFLGQWGKPGDGPGQFNMPWGLSLDELGNVYVADWRNDRIQKFDPSGSFLAQWGRSGRGAGEFHRPSHVAVDAQGMIYVADWGNERVQILSPDGEVLAVLRGDSVDSKWAQEYFAANPDEATQRRKANLEPVIKPHPEQAREESANVEKLLWGPTAVKLDAAGRIYIVDSCRHRIQIYQKTAVEARQTGKI
ncbi:MAG: NHL repeat-containing protein [Chloroflexi bacterium]|nr:NHL repeat-containing protein [Chloroflexota bacterium]